LSAGGWRSHQFDPVPAQGKFLMDMTPDNPFDRGEPIHKIEEIRRVLQDHGVHPWTVDGNRMMMHGDEDMIGPVLTEGFLQEYS